MDKKGQSALEYLMTYGWALVVIVIVVAALVVFGVFSTPTNCSPFTGDLLLKEFSVTASGVTLAIQNMSVGNITVTDIAATGTGGDMDAYAGGDVVVGIGDTNSFSLTGDLSGSVNQVITVTYNTPNITGKTDQTTCVATIS